MRILSPDGTFRMSPEHRAEITEFICNTPAGQTLFEYLEFMVPDLIEDGTPEKILVRSGKVSGAKEQLQNIRVLVSPDPQAPRDPTVESYPNLDDDSKWKDVRVG